MRSLAILMLFAVLPPRSARCEAPARTMVVAGSGPAAEAGLQILQAGGSAADAAVTVLMVLSVAEPQAAGIGGGAVLVYFDAAARAITTWDGRETAPAAAIPGSADGAAVTGGQAVGVPGAVRMLEAVHRARGRLPWADLLAPAIRLADQGTPVSANLARAIAAEPSALRRQPQALGVFFSPDGAPLRQGATLTNPALAQTLRAIGSGGANGLLHGSIAADLAIAVRGDEKPGLLTTDDLAAYGARERPPACTPYRSASVCTAPPPAGAIALLETLGLLDRLDLAALDPGGPAAASLLVQVAQLAAADAARYSADPDFAAVPLSGLLGATYLTERARGIDGAHATKAEAGNPAAAPIGRAGQKPQPEEGSSSIVVIDAQGNAVAMTATLGAPFGSHLFVHGFPLNAALADFSPAEPDDPPALNQIQPGKRPATALAPLIALDSGGNLLAVVGSTGGSRITAYEVGALTGLLDWRMTPAQAVAAPHIAAEPGVALLEADTTAAILASALVASGEAVEVTDMPSGTVMVAMTPPGLMGAADPRDAGGAVAAAGGRPQ